MKTSGVRTMEALMHRIIEDDELKQVDYLSPDHVFGGAKKYYHFNNHNTHNYEYCDCTVR